MKFSVEPRLRGIQQQVLRATLAGILVAAAQLAPSVQGAETERLCLSDTGKDDPVSWEFKCTYGAQSGY